MAISETIYGVLPPWAQNVAISVYGLRWRNERLGGRFEDYVREFQERDRWTPEAMTAYVEEKLRGRLLKAFSEVPYYRERWRSAGIRRSDLAAMKLGDLTKLPITPKQDLRQQSNRFVADSAAKSGHTVRSYHSSGSTGTPITSLCTADDHRRFIAAREVRSFQWAGATLHSSRSMIGGRMIVTRPHSPPPYYRHNWVERQTYFSAYHIGPTTAAHYVEGLNRYRPEVLTGYAQSHFLLGRMILAQGLKLNYSPRALILSSEKLTGQAKHVIQEAFRARAYEEYGAVENCVLATECENGSLHAHSDFGVLEIVDEMGTPVGPGIEGRIVCTGLLNDTQLTIRYDIGDIAAWSATRCGCGRDHLPVLEGVTGRVEDVVVGPDGREMVRFHGLFINLPCVMAGQVIQESRHTLLIRVIPAPGFGDADAEVIRKRVYDRLGPMQVLIERVAELERTNRGKIRAVISRLQQTTDADDRKSTAVGGPAA